MGDFDNLSVNELLELFEKDTTTLRFNRSEVLIKSIKHLEEAKETDKISDIKKEILVIDLYAPLNNRKPRFQPMMSGKTQDGKDWEYPNLKTDFPEDSIEYYKKKLELSKNPILLARYSDFLWVYKKEIEYAKKSVNFYLECVDIYLKNDWGSELADALLRALEISKSIKSKDLQDKSTSKIIEIIDTLKDAKNYRYLLEIVDGIIKNSENINLDRLIETIEEALNHFYNNQDDSYILQREFLGLLIKIYKNKKDTKKKEETEFRIVGNLIQEAEWKKTHYPNGNLIAHSIYQEALKTCFDLGRYPKKVEEIKLSIQGLGSPSQESFKAIKAEVSIPNKVIDDYISSFKDLDVRKTIEAISVDNSLIPDYEKSKESAIDIMKESIMHLFPLSIRRGNLQVKTITEENDKLEYQIIKQFQMQYKITSKLLLPKIFEILENKNSNYTKDLIKFISDCPFINKKRIPFIISGLEAFKNKNYVASMHILVFQVEGISRDILELMNISVFTLRNKEMQAILFSGIIKSLSSIDGFDKNLVKFISIFLNDSMGDNLRNGIAHSLSEIEEFNRENTLLTILIILKLCAYKPIKKS